MSTQIDEQCNPLLSPQSFCSCGKVAQTNEGAARHCRRCKRAKHAIVAPGSQGVLRGGRADAGPAPPAAARSASSPSAPPPVWWCDPPAVGDQEMQHIRASHHKWESADTETKNRWTPASSRSQSVPLCAGKKYKIGFFLTYPPNYRQKNPSNLFVRSQTFCNIDTQPSLANIQWQQLGLSIILRVSKNFIAPNFLSSFQFSFTEK